MTDAQRRSKIFQKKPEKRVYSTQFGRGSIEEFVKASENAKKCWNCLDLPVLNPEIPPFVRYIVSVFCVHTDMTLMSIIQATHGRYGRHHGNVFQVLHHQQWCLI